MNLHIEKESLTSYLIKDNDKILYSCKKSILSFGDKFIIYDENNLQLAEVKQTPLGKTEYKLYMNGSVIDEVIVKDKTPIKNYLLSNKKWLITNDITYTKFAVTNDKNNKIISLDKDLVEPYIWNLSIETTEKLLAIIISVTILSIENKFRA